MPDHQLSLAIGREGQNARLSARLTGVRVDIRSETQVAEGVPAGSYLDDHVEYAEGEWKENEAGEMEWHAADGSVISQADWIAQTEGGEAAETTATETTGAAATAEAPETTATETTDAGTTESTETTEAAESSEDADAVPAEADEADDAPAASAEASADDAEPEVAASAEGEDDAAG